MPPDTPYIAVDIGNSRIKLGHFTGARDEAGLPFPTRVAERSATSFDPASLEEWLAAVTAQGCESTPWWIASVNSPPTELLTAWLTQRGGREFDTRAGVLPRDWENSRSRDRFCLLQHTDLPLAVPLAEPGRVGIDRLLGAVAANHLRANDRAAVVIDVGSAITVDLVSAGGEFSGGAILPTCVST